MGAWKATLDDGRRLRFLGFGIYNSQLVIADRLTHSIWNHCEPIAIRGELQGTVLDDLPQWHTTWELWRTWHPDTLVMAEVTDDPWHRDQRQGHGRDEIWERRGMGGRDREWFKDTLATVLDKRLPEQEMVYGVNEPDGTRAYPYRQVKHNGNIVNDDLGGLPVVVWCDPAPDGFTMGAYDRRLDGHVLRFELRGDRFVDTETGSTWHLEGHATSGPLKGRRLRKLRGYWARWHSWAVDRPQTEIYRTPLRLPEESRWGIDAGIFQPILQAFRSELGLGVTVEEEIVSYGLPAGARRGIVIRLDGHPFRLFHTHGVEHARDLEALAHDWFVKPRCLAHGRFVLKDEPDVQYADWEHWARLPDDRIEWSRLLADERFTGVLRAACELADPDPRRAEPALVEILEALGAHGHVVGYGYRDGVVAPRIGLVRHSNFSAQVLLNGQAMLLYRFDSAESAQAYAGNIGHAVAAHNYVFRSWPVEVWWLPQFEIGQKPDEAVGWAPLVEDASFGRLCEEIIGRLKESLRSITPPPRPARW